VGAFAVLEALGHADGGLGLTGLARASGLANTSAYRLAQQLIELGVVQYVDHTYYVGHRIWRLGQHRQPDPALRQAGQAPLHILAVQSRAVASLRILHDGRLRAICITLPQGHPYIPESADAESTARTATGRVHYASRGCLGDRFAGGLDNTDRTLSAFRINLRVSGIPTPQSACLHGSGESSLGLNWFLD